MANRRIYYPIEMVGFSKVGQTSYIEAHGAQSAGINTTITINRINELGQVNTYANVEAVPDVELTVEKVLDGYPLLWHLATNGSPNASLASRSTIATNAAMSFFDDTKEASSGLPISQVVLSGMVPSQISYTIPVDGECRESITFIGSEQKWTANPTGPTAFSGVFNNQDQPLALLSGSGGIQAKEDVLWSPPAGFPVTLDVNGIVKAFCTALPTDVRGMSSSGTNNLVAGQFSAHVQGITISASLNRESLFELGRKTPFFRYANFPIDVTAEITTLNLDGAFIDISENGVQTGIYVGDNTRNQSIRVALRDGTYIDCGTQNRLTSCNQSGGDTGGGVSTLVYSYTNSSFLTVTHPRDPSNLPWPF